LLITNWGLCSVCFLFKFQHLRRQVMQ
jgi:hypothetical protein